MMVALTLLILCVWTMGYVYSYSKDEYSNNHANWLLNALLAVLITFFLGGGLFRTEVMITYDHPQAGEVINESLPEYVYEETSQEVVSAGDYLSNLFFETKEWQNVSIVCADGTYFNRSSSPTYILIMCLLLCSPMLHLWAKRIQTGNPFTWSNLLNKAILLFLAVFISGAFILHVFEGLFYEIITDEEGQKMYDSVQFLSALDDWEKPIHPSRMISVFILPIFLIVVRIVLYATPEEKIAMQKAKKEDNNNRAAAIENIKRAKELKELGVISEDEFEEILRKHKGDATKGL